MREYLGDEEEESKRSGKPFLTFFVLLLIVFLLIFIFRWMFSFKMFGGA